MGTREKIAIGLLALTDVIPDLWQIWATDLRQSDKVHITTQHHLSETGPTPDAWQQTTPKQLMQNLDRQDWDLSLNLSLDLIILLPGDCQPGALVPILDQGIPGNGLILLPPPLPFPLETAQTFPQPGVAWAIEPSLLQAGLNQWNATGSLNCHNLRDRLTTPLALADALEKQGIFLSWQVGDEFEIGSPSTNLQSSRVLAIVPHWGCEAWLPRCLASLVNQSRPPDQIVVVDDASAKPPIAPVTQFPQVTLVQADRRVGPYRLIQQVIEATQFDWYLFQDADDWSSRDRLERLLVKALNTQAELVGSQEMRVFDPDPNLMPVRYPLDVNAALAEKPGHGLLHPTSLVARDLVIRLGGFATGWQFGADSEFLLRAAVGAQVVNIPRYSYFRRKRPGSLTTDPKTGLDSPARQQMLKQIKERAIANRAAQAAGQIPDLRPLSTSPPVNLTHLTGPNLWR